MTYPDVLRKYSKLVFRWCVEVDNHELVWFGWVRQTVIAVVIEGQYIEVTYYTKLLPQEEWDSGK